ncbi:hypothetical protein [Paracoccus salsus]|uniref:hypothetical protein n=1 Tax=Paracoccus salsus TaxID=2911061 RepID=UPI001F45C39A|nr:hypothetical protein [Paracoccus salsus]
MIRNMPLPSAPTTGWIVAGALLAAGTLLEGPTLVVVGLGVAGMTLALEAVRRWLS